MKKIAVKVEMVVGIFMSSASMILQAGIGITIFVGTILLVNGQIELLPLLMFFLDCNKDIWTDISYFISINYIIKS